MECTIYDYMNWRGDLSFEQDPLNEVDALIFSELTYVDYKLLQEKVQDNHRLTLALASELMKDINMKDHLPKGYKLRGQSYDLLDRAGQLPRYSDCYVEDVVYERSQVEESQFGAMTLVDSNGKDLAVVFQGTDNYSLAWKENFKLAYLPFIPAQEKALDYLSRRLNQKGDDLIVGTTDYNLANVGKAIDSIKNLSSESKESIYAFFSIMFKSLIGDK